MKYKLNRSFDDIYQACIYSATANAVSNLRFPFFSAEHSWERVNYSSNYVSNVGTITFDLPNKTLVGAIREDTSERIMWYPNYNAIELLTAAPDSIKLLAQNEAFQYLLLGFDEKVKFWQRPKPSVTVPVITTVLWSEGDEIYSCDDYDNFFLNGGDISMRILMTIQELQVYWQDNSDFTDEEMNFVNYLFRQKMQSNSNIKVDVASYIAKDSEGYINYIDKNSNGYKEFLTSMNELGFEI
ncbi:MAG: hypothetical protein LBC73_04845 [Oscillospiraceae bacterium]|jgi:hypothetical protein|nr:hypothetical protein [Oscillospiraceae bacterium]